MLTFSALPFLHHISIFLALLRSNKLGIFSIESELVLKNANSRYHPFRFIVACNPSKNGCCQFSLHSACGFDPTNPSNGKAHRRANPASHHTLSRSENAGNADHLRQIQLIFCWLVLSFQSSGCRVAYFKRLFYVSYAVHCYISQPVSGHFFYFFMKLAGRLRRCHCTLLISVSPDDKIKTCTFSYYSVVMLAHKPQI